MALFTHDQDHVVQQVRYLAGADRTEVAYFADSPLRGSGDGPPWTWRRYEPPVRETRILLLSDLGMGSSRIDPWGANRAEWEKFADLVSQHECHVAALVPYPARRFPRWMARLFAVVSWDRSLTAGRASRAVP
jgi:hypothetical protein